MPRINGQLAIYLVVGAVILLVGLRSVQAGKTGPASLHSGATAGKDDGLESGSDGLKVSAGSRKLIVDVAGEVRRPGVYRFAHGARVIDAINRAGGVTRAALPGAINRAATLSDGQQVVVPARGAAANAAGNVTGGAAAPDAPISLGTASQAELEEIDGIGPVTAAKIIEFRDSQGGLGSVDELDQVSGIGPVTMETLRAALSP